MKKTWVTLLVFSIWSGISVRAEDKASADPHPLFIYVSQYATATEIWRAQCFSYSKQPTCSITMLYVSNAKNDVSKCEIRGSTKVDGVAARRIGDSWVIEQKTDCLTTKYQLSPAEMDITRTDTCGSILGTHGEKVKAASAKFERLPDINIEGCKGMRYGGLFD